MGNVSKSLIGLGSFWILSVVIGVFAVMGSRRVASQRGWLPLGLALIAIAIGVVGFWTPFSMWPRLAYTWANGDFSVTIDFSWFFALPLLLGVLAVVLLFRGRSAARTGAMPDKIQSPPLPK